MEIEVAEGVPKHAKMILKELGLEKCKDINLPRKHDDGGPDEGAILEKGEVTRFRPCLMHLSYLAQDRVDLPEVVKGFPNEMANLTQKAMLKARSGVLEGETSL